MRIEYERLAEILSGFDPDEHYSGRNMYGRTCLSVTTGEGQSELRMLADIIENCDDVGEAAEILRGVRTDGMGRSTVLYWPHVRPKIAEDRAGGAGG